MYGGRQLLGTFVLNEDSNIATGSSQNASRRSRQNLQKQRADQYKMINSHDRELSRSKKEIPPAWIQDT